MNNNNTFKNTALVFLIRQSEEMISDVCLAMKKRGFGVGRWNGIGGKVRDDESVEDAARRETSEEINVEVGEIVKVAEMFFSFSQNPEWNNTVHAYLSLDWHGEPKESEEMAPRWFKINDIPFDKMWPTDRFWIPEIFSGKLLKASFVLGENDEMVEKKIELVKEF